MDRTTAVFYVDSINNLQDHDAARLPQTVLYLRWKIEWGFIWPIVLRRLWLSVNVDVPLFKGLSTFRTVYQILHYLQWQTRTSRALKYPGLHSHLPGVLSETNLPIHMWVRWPFPAYFVLVGGLLRRLLTVLPCYRWIQRFLRRFSAGSFGGVDREMLWQRLEDSFQECDYHYPSWFEHMWTPQPNTPTRFY